MNSIHLLLSACLAVFGHQQVLATDSLATSRIDSPLSLSLEFSTKYMWRGIEYGNAPTTFAILSYEKGGFNAYVEGVYAVNGSHSEVDLGIGYSFKYLSIGLADYYFPSSVGEKDKYFKLNSRETGHYVEAYTTISPLKIPVWLTLSCYVFGADKNKKGNQAYSSYAELGYTHTFNAKDSISLAVGANLNKGFYTDYRKNFNVVNITLKYATSFKFGSFQLPVSASYVLNPYREKSYFTFSVYFNSKQ